MVFLPSVILRTDGYCAISSSSVVLPMAMGERFFYIFLSYEANLLKKQPEATIVNTVRIGVIGTSFISDFYHLSILSALPDAELVAVCGRNDERAREVAEKHSIPRVFADYREMIGSGLLDAVVIATPDDLHYPMTMEAISKGLHVLCEKPLALNVTQAREMRDAAKSAQLVTLVNHTWRWMPACRYARKLINEGYVGNLHRAVFQYRAGYGRSKKKEWKFNAMRDNGALGDIGSHMIDMARYLVGEITEVSAKLKPCANIVPGEATDLENIGPSNDMASLLLGFAGGETAFIVASAIDYLGGQHQRVELHGTEGSLEISFKLKGDTQIHCIRGEEYTEETLEIPVEFGGKPSFDGLPDYFASHDIGPQLFVRSILGQAVPAPTFDDGYRIQRVMDAAIESNSRGVRIAIT